MKQYYQIPTTCPECGSAAKEEGAYLMCTNDSCSGLGTGNLERWINVLNIDSIGPKLIQVLYEKGIVKEPADFYNLTAEQVSGLERMGERSAAKIVKNLRDKMEITLPEFIAGLNMPQFSTSTAEALMEAGYDGIVKIFNAQESELTQIKGIEIKTAQQILKGIRSKAAIIKNLFDAGIKIKQPEKIELSSEKLIGSSFCFTGKIEAINPKTQKNYTRDDMHKLVVENGGKVEESVRKGLSYLVMADPNSTKNKAQDARRLGINILGEADFFKMVF
jgi:DNA ligase (NAD+)